MTCGQEAPSVGIRTLDPASWPDPSPLWTSHRGPLNKLSALASEGLT
jgi:hypothetical protein